MRNFALLISALNVWAFGTLAEASQQMTCYRQFPAEKTIQLKALVQDNFELRKIELQETAQKKSSQTMKWNQTLDAEPRGSSVLFKLSNPNTGSCSTGLQFVVDGRLSEKSGAFLGTLVCQGQSENWPLTCYITESN